MHRSNQMGKWRFSMRKYRVFCVLMLAILLIPMIWAGFYTRPAGDDLRQPLLARLSVAAGGSFWDAVNAALQNMSILYQGWNGVFFSMFLSALPPFVFGAQWNFVAPTLFLLMLVAACYMVFSTLERLLHFSKAATHCATCIVSFTLICFIEALDDALYWYAGAVNYTFMFALSVILFTSALRCYVITPQESNGSVILKTVLLMIGCFLLGGGNFSTSTVSVAFFGLLALYQCYRVFQKKASAKALLALLPLAALLAGYFISIIAPGNAHRQSGMFQPPFAIAVFSAFRYTVAFIEKYFSLDILAMILLFIPVAVSMVRRTEFAFPYPLLVMALSYLLIVAGFMPPMVSMGGEGPPRLVSIQIMLYQLLLFLNVLYCTGWAYRKALALAGAQSVSDALAAPQTHRAVICGTALAVCLLGVCAFRFMQFYPVRINTTNSALHVAMACLSGEVQMYAEDYDDIVRLCEENPGGDIEVTPYRSAPDIYVLQPISMEASDNVDVANYYGVSSVKMIPN